MTILIKRINNLRITNRSSIVVILILISTSKVLCQSDSLRLAQLINVTNDLFIAPFAQGVYLSPFELRQHHRDNTIKNIEWVTSFDLYISYSSKKDTIPFVVKDNQTIIQKPDERYNSRTYSFHKDGRIDKIFRGRHVADFFLYDINGVLIQHGNGGELKRAKQKDGNFEWYNVKRNRLEYITSYNIEHRLSKIKTMGHLFGPGVEYEMEEYLWEENHLISNNSIRKYKEGKPDSTFVKYTYDSLGLISSFSFRKDGESNWSTTQFDTSIEYKENKHIKISITNADQPALSITFDQYDNIIERITSYNQQRREIKYRKIKRWKWF